ncbi:4Fe-4S dicluster domain-containing protein [Desulfosediminicola sp.]|uniref:4Fe-4S dicluster domain-containing protein n=1 Tax=Desulfosediminicola sp. TaxID=2886825 RepID=UPI003AF29207
MKISRRNFLKGSAMAGALTVLPKVDAHAAPAPESYATLIDLSKCDGCAGKDTPLCVAGCRSGRAQDFPEPIQDQVRDYWPQKKHEDWSNKRHVTDRFTPYNWLFVQQVQVGGQTLSIPRRCMHCDNPPCVKLCPFGINHKTPEGPVYIQENLCMGGAKCRNVCPWSVPQRQAGVGLYTYIQDYLPMGGGVMFKCDLCRKELVQGGTPHCISACPKDAMSIGSREAILARAEELKDEYDGDIYGMDENGGTSTIYVSPVAFSEIDAALQKAAAEQGTKKVVRLNKPENMLEKQKGLALLSLVAPVIGAVAAFGLAGRKTTDEEVQK